MEQNSQPLTEQDNNKFKQDQIDQRLVRNGQLVEDGLQSEFWQEIVGPELHRMITGGIGYQMPNGKWVNGEWSKSSVSIDNAKYIAGYTKGLQDFSNNLLAFIDAKNNVINRKERDKKQPDVLYPMTEEIDDYR